MKLGDRIKALRTACGWSQQTLASTAGVSQQLIAKLESGEVRETRKLQKISKAFGMSADRLLSDDPWENGEIGGSMEHARVATDEFDVMRMYVNLPGHLRAHVRGIIEALSTSQGDQHGA